MTLCKRKLDGAMFRPSFPDDYNAGKAIAAAITGKADFFFRGVRWQPRRWWQLKGRWVDTGEIWQPESGEFDVIDTRRLS